MDCFSGSLTFPSAAASSSASRYQSTSDKKFVLDFTDDKLHLAGHHRTHCSKAEKTLAKSLCYPRLWAGTRRAIYKPIRGIMTISNEGTAKEPALNSQLDVHGSNGAAGTSQSKKMHGRAFYESIGSPKFVLAPMVDQSEFVRSLFLSSDVDLIYTAGMANAFPLLYVS